MLNKKAVPFPVNITWMITNQCNYNCSFCFRFVDRHKLEYSQAKKIIDKLAKSGTKKISWAGGEPMLWPRMIDLIEYTRSLGITTMLITNGELITPRVMEKLGQCLDWLNLPLDGPDAETNTLMTRKFGHYDRVIDLLKLAPQYGIKTKINTVISNLNKNTIPFILPLINEYQIKRWKLFQFYPIRGYSLTNKDQHIISPNDFQLVKEQVLSKVHNNSCAIVFETCKELDQSYFSLAPDGNVYISLKGHDYIIGDLKKDSVAKIWKNDMLDKDKYWQRAKWVLNGKTNT